MIQPKDPATRAPAAISAIWSPTPIASSTQLFTIQYRMTEGAPTMVSFMLVAVSVVHTLAIVDSVSKSVGTPPAGFTTRLSYEGSCQMACFCTRHREQARRKIYGTPVPSTGFCSTGIHRSVFRDATFRFASPWALLANANYILLLLTYWKSNVTDG